MENYPNAKLLRILIGESEKIGHETLYETIVFEANKKGLLGATVTRGIMGFGANSKIHTAKLLEISSDLPIIIEIVDNEEKIRNFTKIVEQLFEEAKSGGLITIEKAEVIRYKAGKKKLEFGRYHKGRAIRLNLFNRQKSLKKGFPLLSLTQNAGPNIILN
jgi:uncharacterized protein